MPFLRPTIVQIRRRIQSDFRHAFQNDAVLYPGTIEHAFCEAIVGLSHAAHGRLDQIYRDAFPHLASEVGVVNWARFYNVFRNRATYAEGPIRVYGTDGSVIPVGTIFARSADGFEYRTLAEHVLAPGTDIIQVRAKTPGTSGNYVTTITNTLSLQGSLPGVSTFADTSVPGCTGGADAELTEALRARLLAVLAEPPGGGTWGDYIRWAKLVTGVTRAWEFGCVPKIGDVTLLFMRDLDPDPFPAGASLTDVEEQIAEFAPIALPPCTVQAPNKYTLTLTIDDLTIEANAVLADVRAAIIVSIQEMIATRAEPAAADGDVFYRSWITEAISTTTGEVDHKLTSPVGDVVLSKWDLVTLDAADVTWT